MPLFDLPVELVGLIFDEIVVSRSFGRMMRLRLVNRHFKFFIDDSIFRLRLLSKFQLSRVVRSSMAREAAASLHAYLHSYTMYQVSRERSVENTVLGRIRIVAEALREQHSDSECLRSLVSLAIEAGGSLMPRELTTYRYGQTNSGIEADVFVAAVYLGREDYVDDAIITGGSLLEDILVGRVKSVIFGSAFEAATMQGDLQMIKMLLRGIPGYYESGSVEDRILHEILYTTSLYHYRNTRSHQAIFDFVLDTIQTNQSTPGSGMSIQLLKSTERFAAIPVNFERANFMLQPFERRSRYSANELLMESIVCGKAEMVRYLLGRGVSPNPTTFTYQGYTSPLVAAIEVGDDTIIKLLLDTEADIHYNADNREGALVTAVWKGRFAVAAMLLNRGVDPNEGEPPPIVFAVLRERLDLFRLLRDHGARLDTPKTGGLAMSIANAHGLSSMQDVLLQEGVSQDIIVSYNKSNRIICSDENSSDNGPDATKALSNLWDI
ncbi:hypothetical protein GQX73_g5779 [Xylaria multiplex]|uniref:Uncharacterized protein n=1 Tax=Xylaria multiplex TaxID=323545 RepID=A0A7C8IQM1_9PEZI|nr:hypothetical protein GQX73_g5779 [Xylaria multiplex]